MEGCLLVLVTSWTLVQTSQLFPIRPRQQDEDIALWLASRTGDQTYIRRREIRFPASKCGDDFQGPVDDDAYMTIFIQSILNQSDAQDSSIRPGLDYGKYIKLSINHLGRSVKEIFRGAFVFVHPRQIHIQVPLL